jgi:hypothetical protein
MMRRGPIAVVIVGAALAGTGWSLQGATRERPDVSTLVAHVSDRVFSYYQRAQQLICIERSTVIPIGTDWSVQGFARTVESELHIEADAAESGSMPEPRVARDVRRVNGREPRERDRTDRSGCTDPTPLSPEPLAFLLPRHREEFRFTAIRDGREGGRPALIIDFASARRTGDPLLVEDERGHDDCFDWQGPVAIAGRLWVDAETHDVLRLERRLGGPTDVRVPARLQRKYLFPQWLTIDRDEQTLRYKRVAFSDPDEVVLLPESIETVTVIRNGLQSMRRSQIFSDYRRFLTGSRIVKRP